jgi:hypothetical protein
MTQSHLPYVAPGRALRTVLTNPAEPAEDSIFSLVAALLSVQRSVDGDPIGYAGVFPVDAYRDLLHAVRVALVNPSSREARSLMRAIGRFDGIRQPLAADPDHLGERPDVASRPPNGPAAA